MAGAGCAQPDRRLGCPLSSPAPVGSGLRPDTSQILVEGAPMPSKTGMPRGRLAGRLIAFYVAMAAIAVAVVIVVVNRGVSEKAQPAIAGGYDASAANGCLGAVAPKAAGAPLPAPPPAQPAPSGPSFNLLQSGQFLNITNNQGTLSGQLRMHPAATAGGG